MVPFEDTQGLADGRMRARLSEPSIRPEALGEIPSVLLF